MNTSKFWLFSAAAFCAVWLAACSTPDSRIQANPEAFARLTPQQQALVKAGQVSIGMDMDAVKLALGDPDRVTLRTDSAGQEQVWHYVTYEADGLILYTGYYQHWHGGRGGWGWGGGWGPWGPAYPYYLDYPNRTVHDRFTVEFKAGKVVVVSQEAP